MAERRECQRETGLDRAASSREERERGNDLREGVRRDQRADGRIRADRAQRELERDTVEHPVCDAKAAIAAG